MKSLRYTEEVIRMQQLTIAKIKELQVTSKMLSEECNKVEVNIYTLKSKELANKEEIPSLESTVLELRKEIAIETEGQQDLLVKKSKAEADKEKFQKELVKMNEVFLKAIAYYKKKLSVRLRFDENEVVLVHFLNISAPGCQMCSLKLSHDDGKWGLLEMEPLLPCEKDLAEKLETTQDMQGFISRVRKLFIQMSDRKMKHATDKKIPKKS